MPQTLCCPKLAILRTARNRIPVFRVNNARTIEGFSTKCISRQRLLTRSAFTLLRGRLSRQSGRIRWHRRQQQEGSRQRAESDSSLGNSDCSLAVCNSGVDRWARRRTTEPLWRESCRRSGLWEIPDRWVSTNRPRSSKEGPSLSQRPLKTTRLLEFKISDRLRFPSVDLPITQKGSKTSSRNCCPLGCSVAQASSPNVGVCSARIDSYTTRRRKLVNNQGNWLRGPKQKSHWFRQWIIWPDVDRTTFENRRLIVWDKRGEMRKPATPHRRRSQCRASRKGKYKLESLP